MTEKEQRDAFLKDEYLKLQDIYEDFDRRSLTIKGWTTTACIGGIALGFDKNLIAICIFSSIIALLFWWLEAKWKTFQYSNSLRIRQIEAYFRGEKQDIIPMQIYNTWFSSYMNDEKLHDMPNPENKRSPGQKTFHNAQLSVVYTPYLYIILIDIILICLKATGSFTATSVISS